MVRKPGVASLNATAGKSRIGSKEMYCCCCEKPLPSTWSSHHMNGQKCMEWECRDTDISGPFRHAGYRTTKHCHATTQTHSQPHLATPRQRIPHLVRLSHEASGQLPAIASCLLCVSNNMVMSVCGSPENGHCRMRCKVDGG